MARVTTLNRAWLAAGLLGFACSLNPQPDLPGDAATSSGGAQSSAGSRAFGGTPDISGGGTQNDEPGLGSGGAPAGAEPPVEAGGASSEAAQGGAGGDSVNATGGDGGETVAAGAAGR